jgi:Domain of Unknown Function (DUF1080)
MLKLFLGNRVWNSKSLWMAFLGAPLVLWGQTTPTVTLPKPDKDGWIQIFRGDNQADFSVYTKNGSPAEEGNSKFGDPFFHQGGDTIRTDGSPFGQLIFKQNFSHFIMEVQLRWPNGLGNCGVMTKIQWNDQGQGGGLPRCIECQGDPQQGMGQIWSLGPNGGRPWISFKGATDSRGAKVDSTKPVMDFGGAGGLNCIVGYPGWQQPRPAALNNGGWVTIRAENHGKDTSRHFVDGQKVMEYWNPRIATTTNANAVSKYLTEGMLSIQSEGPTVWYRNWRIKILPEDPLYASLYTTSLFPAWQRKPISTRTRTPAAGLSWVALADGRVLLNALGRHTGAIPAGGAAVARPAVAGAAQTTWMPSRD